MKSFIESNSLFIILKNSLISLPTPININLWWNFGSILGICLLTQIISGLMLSFHYSPNISLAFDSIIHMNHNVNKGWILHFIHMNGASMFFFSIYSHIGRNIYYNSFINKKTWVSGTFIILVLMMTAFIGYVLPWGQMSFWGATVITNLLSAIPLIGNLLVQWIWGGFSINNATLNRFYSFHFILPFILMFMVIMHLMFLHEVGSSNPLGSTSNLFKMPFHNFFTIKDFLGFNLLFFMFILLIMIDPYLLGDPENFNPANPLSTPPHIQPEWYFLFAYAILRSIPNKLGGVIALMASILILLIMPIFSFNKTQSNKFFPLNKILTWVFLNLFLMLTWIGTMPVEPPFIFLGQNLTILYFVFFFIYPLIHKYSHKKFKK